MKINDPKVIKKNGLFYKKGQTQLVLLRKGTCQQCGKEYLTRKHQRATSKYCDRWCRGKADRGNCNPNWKGGRSLHAGGYVRVYDQDHPSSMSRGRIFEHRLVMEKHLGRPLLPIETVHHKNGVRDDNRLENLELHNGQHGKSQRVADKVEYAKEILALYGHLA